MKIKWSRAQYQIHRNKSQFLFIVKGRRFGLTRFKAEEYIVRMVNGEGPFLWGDTINSNIDRYVQRYFLPLLKSLTGQVEWKWRQQKKELTIEGQYIDFRSADKPENWEGFGYREIFLNEAGIILDGESGKYLYENAVLPMLIDFDGSKLVAGGAPKGENLFFDLYREAEEDETGLKSVMQFTSYDNPFISRSNIDLMASQMDPITRDQEIFGKFVNLVEKPFCYAFDPDKHVSEIEPFPGPLLISFDFNVEPFTATVHQFGEDFFYTIDEILIPHEPGIDQIKAMSEEIRIKYPNAFFTVTGDASGRARDVSSKVNAYQSLQYHLGLNDGQMEQPRRNMGLANSRVLCNTALYSFNLKVHPRCKTLIREMKNARMKNGKLWKDRKEHKNDALDSWRYAIHYALADILDWI